jgi:G-patch domain.
MKEIYHVIEEEPSHEIYANVVGLKLTNHTTTSQSTRAPSSIRESTSSSSDCTCSTHATSTAASKVKQEEEGLNVPYQHDESTSSTSRHADHIDARSTHANGVVLIPLGEDLNKNRHSDEFCSIYRKRLAEPLPSSSTSQISLDKSNKGFRLLEKMGWKEIQGGLGSRRQGILEPIQTTLKNDKRGIGSLKKLPSKVTHLMGRNKQQQQTSMGTDDVILQDGASRSKKARMLITSDLPDEYFSLF